MNLIRMSVVSKLVKHCEDLERKTEYLDENKPREICLIPFSRFFDPTHFGLNEMKSNRTLAG